MSVSNGKILEQSPSVTDTFSKFKEDDKIKDQEAHLKDQRNR